ncbi:hypothetical protein GOQ27_12250 [Clostridium sp. D2Q-11]|uniref:Uncharacterized protein n=1 Tax=Anaeromonas frigoriresistens TaxID=2683708 RepID=A0A942UU89_9FIRM|nr:hypothetical protein [Anaeromonas frigoriresistens]MBS4539238.1 hypothetical protein [Anaeromonas frigoriresistens]
MFKLGVLLFLISTSLVLGADRQYRKGKITDLKSLLKVKLVGLGITVVSVIFMIYGK